MEFKVGDLVKVDSPSIWRGMSGRVADVSVSTCAVRFADGAYGIVYKRSLTHTETETMKIGDHEVKVVSKTEVMVGCQKVTYQQVLAVRDLMDRYVEPPKLDVGDFVKVVSKPSNNDGAEKLIGKFGKIQRLHGLFSCDVEFAEPINKILGLPGGHHLHVWACSGESLVKADD